MTRRILIVDDNAINRQLLMNTLRADYEPLEAENGKEALELLHRHYRMLSAVLLDLMMPEMDGYEVLRRVRDNALLAQIPIIVVTGSEDEEARIKALSLGANDFILKPFNPEIVKHCLKNNIALRETASILNAIQRDKLTGLYNRETFFEKASGMIAEREPGHYMLSCFDVDNFKLINDQYGATEGDRILREIGKAVQRNADEIGGVAGRISADNFAALFPVDQRNTEVLQRILSKSLVSLEQQSISFSIGRYVVNDVSLPVSAIYDRAFIAKQSVKGRYDEHIAYFDEAMLERLVREQQITGEMEAALKERQFEAWFQPQYDHATGALLGAEALARWRSPQKGVIPPGEFIPLFEQNGFVYELDKYIWREACRRLRQWADAGYAPLPVSVNISRYDIFRADLIETLEGLIREYAVPVDLLRLEITESAFTASSERIVSIVKQLIALGFTVEIDDFGSGYSSLNTLKNVPAQVVKLDMRFLEGGDDAHRGGNILESIVRMTKWLGMTVLAEGVEELEQADFLKSIGCTYVQGYLYARPMPAEDYEALLAGSVAPAAVEPEGAIELPDGDFWDLKSIDSVVFNKYSGGACVYEFHNGRIELIRITDKYIRTVFGAALSAADAMRLDWIDHVDEPTAKALADAVMESVRTGQEIVGEYRFTSLPGCPPETHLRTSLRVIASTGDRYLVYCTSENITPQREAERRADALELLTNNIPGGIATYEGSPGAPGEIRLTYFSDGFCRLFGYEREEYAALAAADPLSLITPADAAETRARIAALLRDGTPMNHAFRVTARDGATKWIHVRAIVGEPGGNGMEINAVALDVTEQRAALEKLRISEEVYRLAIQQSRSVVGQYDVSSQQLHLSPNADPDFGLTDVEEDVPRKEVADGRISPETAEAYTAFYESIHRGDKRGEVRYQRKSARGWRWVAAHSTTIFSDSGEPETAVISYADVTEDMEKEAAYKKWRQSFRDRKPESYSLYHCNLNQNLVLSAVEGMLIPEELDLRTPYLTERTEQYAKKCVLPEDRAAFRAMMDREAQLLRHTHGKRSDSLEYREALPDGGTRWLRVTIDLVDFPYSTDVEAYILFEDVDEAKRAELEIIERAETDPLTGVLNRATFAQKVDQLLHDAAPNERHALLMLDLDGFKLVNDVFGHGAGDQTLVDVAELLRGCSRRGDLVGRLGGDEFVVFLADIPSKAAAATKARQICELTRKTLSLEVQISGSVGVALYPQDGDSFETLYKKADDTLYYVKGAGKNQYAFYRDGVSQDAMPKPAQGDAIFLGRKRTRRMLIVDDSRIDADMLANMFSGDFKVEKATDGSSALIKLHHYGSAISIVLLDLRMPGLDGFSVLERIEQSAETKSIPVIVVSGTNDHEASLRAIRAGAADFVTKPVDPDVLRIRVQSAVSKAENERLRAQNSFLALQSSEINDYKTVLERTGTMVIAHDWVKGTFAYSPSVAKRLHGTYDGRSLWYILLSDLVADSQTVQRMQQLVHDVANDRTRTEGRMTTRLKSISGEMREYEMNVYKQANDYGLTDKLMLTFKEKDASNTTSG